MSSFVTRAVLAALAALGQALELVRYLGADARAERRAHRLRVAREVVLLRLDVDRLRRESELRRVDLRERTDSASAVPGGVLGEVPAYDSCDADGDGDGYAGGIFGDAVVPTVWEAACGRCPCGDDAHPSEWAQHQECWDAYYARARGGA